VSCIDQELGGTAKCGVWPIWGRIDHKPWRIETPDKLPQRDLRLEACERGPEAVVDASQESKMLIIGAVGNEPIRLGEAGLVSVRGGQQQH
jgi:hypothetical protein